MPAATASISSSAGIGLRPPHYRAILELMPAVSFLEVHSENFFGDGGQPLKYLARLREDYPISTHGVGLSLGSTDPLAVDHLKKLKRLVDAVEPVLISEHLCWVGVNGRFLNDLLPLPYTVESLAHVVQRVGEVQDFLKRAILIENVSSYLEFSESTIPEWEFVREVANRSGCQILLDVNNIYVNAVNHDFDAHGYLDTIAPGSVGEIHLAGFQDTGEVLIDTHGATVSDEVWRLYEYAIQRFGCVPTLVEWDTDIPALPVLLGEAEKANGILAAHAQRAANAA
ncbi:MAG: DUF692 domain-containing protein [Burkholderiales bacterium]|nr:DUF692 domain-containing protein [Burkholderiales bacterium]